MNFKNFVGNDNVKTGLNNLFSAGRLPHAIILQGEDGLGKSALSRLIAKAILCENSDNDIKPCCNCRACRQFEAGSHPDLRIVEGSNKGGAFAVKDIAFLTTDCYKAPEESDSNVYILESGKIFPEIGQNKLLKVIEEPPAGCYFIINIPNAESLLTTIRSRSAIISLHPVSKYEAERFCMDKTACTGEEAENAYEIYQGNIGNMLDFIEGKTKDNKAVIIAAEVAALAAASDANALLKTTAPLIDNRKLFQEVSKLLEAIFRDAIVLRSGGKSMIGMARDVSEELASKRTMTKLIHLPDLCVKYRTMCEGNVNMKLLVTSFCAELRNAI
ncbi:MAG: hypothetical protein Q4C42_02020 [Clostridia bacterium]|nr:hypothetical protein [Clostridia bacterium]